MDNTYSLAVDRAVKSLYVDDFNGLIKDFKVAATNPIQGNVYVTVHLLVDMNVYWLEDPNDKYTGGWYNINNAKEKIIKIIKYLDIDEGNIKFESYLDDNPSDVEKFNSIGKTDDSEE